MSGKRHMKRIQVTFTNEQWKIIVSMKGEMGNTDAEVIRNVVLAWLAEKSLISEKVKRKTGES